MLPTNIHEDYLRSILFGLQDGLVSTTGVVVGITVGVADKPIIILASLVAVSVEATSMAAGQYSSEKAVHQMDRTGKHTDSLVLGAFLMFISYLLAGFVPITPIVLLDLSIAPIISVISAFIALFTVGFIKGKIVEHHPLRSAFEMFIIGSIATALGLIVGHLLKV
ncbi:MAG: VIT1/CCC1 transporter family protein [Candidatus Daviesbacteria bacterium]|nr:VIT1/CCC1 transporter family protein [Candidatus Daviesbacteria bacterium]